MERTKTQARWKYVGGGALYLKDKRKINPGDVFTASPADVPAAFMDTIKPMGDLPQEREVKPVYREYIIKKRETGAWYDIFDDAGKKINEKGLKKEAAEEMVKSLIPEA